MVHCLAGLGRTGTILACYLIKYEEMSADDAIQKVRNERSWVDSIIFTRRDNFPDLKEFCKEIKLFFNFRYQFSINYFELN